MSRAEEILQENGIKPIEKVETPKPDNIVIDKSEEGNPDEVDDEDLLKKLQKKGFNITSLDQLNKPTPEPKVLTAEEQDQEIKNQRALARRYALDNKLVNEDLLSSYDQDSERAEDAIAFELFKEDLLASIKGTDEEGSYTDEDIEDIWNNMNYVEEEESSIKKKLRKQEISKIAKRHLQTKYGDVLNIENSYKNFQEEAKQATQYKGIVEQAVAKLPKKFTFQISGVDIEYEPTSETLEQAKNTYLDPVAFKAFGKDATVEGLVKSIQTLVTAKEFDRVLAEVSNSYYTQKVATLKMGRQGIIDRELGSGEENSNNLGETPRAMELLNENKK